MIDWVIAERIATFVGGSSNGHMPRDDLKALATESEARVTA